MQASMHAGLSAQWYGSTSSENSNADQVSDLFQSCTPMDVSRCPVLLLSAMDLPSLVPCMGIYVRPSSDTCAEQEHACSAYASQSSPFFLHCFMIGLYPGKIVLCVAEQTASLGTYEDEADAAKAYDEAHFEIYGRGDLLNFPRENADVDTDNPPKPLGRGEMPGRVKSLCGLHQETMMWQVVSCKICGQISAPASCQRIFMSTCHVLPT